MTYESGKTEPVTCIPTLFMVWPLDWEEVQPEVQFVESTVTDTITVGDVFHINGHLTINDVKIENSGSGNVYYTGNGNIEVPERQATAQSTTQKPSHKYDTGFTLGIGNSFHVMPISLSNPPSNPNLTLEEKSFDFVSRNIPSFSLGYQAQNWGFMVSGKKSLAPLSLNRSFADQPINGMQGFHQVSQEVDLWSIGATLNLSTAWFGVYGGASHTEMNSEEASSSFIRTFLPHGGFMDDGSGPDFVTESSVQQFNWKAGLHLKAKKDFTFTAGVTMNKQFKEIRTIDLGIALTF